MTRILLVGAGAFARAAAQSLQHQRQVEIIGALTLPDENTTGLTVPVLGAWLALPGMLARHHIDAVYLAGDVSAHYSELQQVVRWCEQAGTPFAEPSSPFRHQRSLRVANGRPDAAGFVHYSCTLQRPWQAAVKRMMDVIGAGLGLLLLSPLLLAIAVAVKFESRGPVLFRQARVGRNGRLFHMIKFRSMRVDAERVRLELEDNEQDGPVFKLRNDPRMTKVGAFIRRFSLDELPQFWNVFTGEMSLVGPRPALPKEVAQYEAWQRRRLSVRPGITCLWQVSGRNAIRFEQWMYLDLQYVDQWSLKSDVSLLLRTVPAVVTGSNAS